MGLQFMHTPRSEERYVPSPNAEVCSPEERKRKGEEVLVGREKKGERRWESRKGEGRKGPTKRNEERGRRGKEGMMVMMVGW